MTQIAAIGEKVAGVLVDLVCEHPAFIGWAAAIFVLATFITNAIKMTWPCYSEMPPAARFVLGFCMPLALNFWSVAKRLGVKQPDDPPLSAAAVAAATKDDGKP